MAWCSSSSLGGGGAHPRVLLHASGAHGSAFWLSNLPQNAPKLWVSAPWSATVLAAQDPAGSSQLLQICRCAAAYELDWMALSPCQVACKLLVTLQLWFWPHCSHLPDHSFAMPKDDPHSFAAYENSILAQMARIAYRVPHFYSLVQRLVFVWWQNAACLLPGCICARVRISAITCAHYGLSPGIQSPDRPNGLMVIRGLVFTPLGASAFSPQCSALPSAAGVVVLWAT